MDFNKPSDFVSAFFAMYSTRARGEVKEMKKLFGNRNYVKFDKPDVLQTVQSEAIFVARQGKKLEKIAKEVSKKGGCVSPSFANWTKGRAIDVFMSLAEVILATSSGITTNDSEKKTYQNEIKEYIYQVGGIKINLKRIEKFDELITQVIDIDSKGKFNTQQVLLYVFLLKFLNEMSLSPKISPQNDKRIAVVNSTKNGIDVLIPCKFFDIVETVELEEKEFERFESL